MTALRRWWCWWVGHEWNDRGWCERCHLTLAEFQDPIGDGTTEGPP